MIILDTDVISELLRRKADAAVVAWVDEHSATELCITSVTAAELLFGVALLPVGHRKRELADAVGQLLELEFGGRILPFDEAAAVAYATLAARRQRMGNRVSMADTMIAAIAETSGARMLATRNVSDFHGVGVDVVNPWAA